MYFSHTIHLVFAVIWVGGMFFAYNALRPAAAKVLEPPLRLTLWVQVFRRFFLWVWLSIFAIITTGYWMLFNNLGGFAGATISIHLMHGLGWCMVAIYLYVFVVPYRNLKQAVNAQSFAEAGIQLNKIRVLVGSNVILGLIVLVIASTGTHP